MLDGCNIKRKDATGRGLAQEYRAGSRIGESDWHMVMRAGPIRLTLERTTTAEESMTHPLWAGQGWGAWGPTSGEAHSQLRESGEIPGRKPSGVFQEGARRAGSRGRLKLEAACEKTFALQVTKVRVQVFEQKSDMI